MEIKNYKDELKQKIEQGKFKIEMISFKPKIKTFLGTTRIYILKADRKVYFLGLKNEITEQFRKLLKSIYGERYFKDYPESFFKRYLHKKFLKSSNKTKLTEKKKKPYYSKMRILSKGNKIKRLKEEIIKEKEELRSLKNYERKIKKH